MPGSSEGGSAGDSQVEIRLHSVKCNPGQEDIASQLRQCKIYNKTRKEHQIVLFPNHCEMHFLDIVTKKQCSLQYPYHHNVPYHPHLSSSNTPKLNHLSSEFGLSTWIINISDFYSITVCQNVPPLQYLLGSTKNYLQLTNYYNFRSVNVIIN